MNTQIISIGTYANHIVENSMKKILDDSIEYWKIDRDEDGYLHVGFIKDCMETCKSSNRIILFVALGGKTGSQVSQLIVDELKSYNLVFTSVVILPNLIEGGINITRALQSVETLIQQSSRIYLWENGTRSTENLHQSSRTYWTE